MNDQEKALAGKGRRMSRAESEEYFKKKAVSKKGSYDLETERLRKELEDFEAQWFEETITKFFAGKEGQEFLEEHKGENPDDVYEIFMKHSNVQELFNVALKKKIDQLRGAVE
ncbi:hypothetical protein ES703_61041 [subsurface metagenome]|nr:hypothetical protein [bacterium]